MSTAPTKRYTPEEYLELERKASYKSEYYQGEIFAMAGATFAHTLIVANILRELGNALRDRRCTSHSSDLRIKIPQTILYTYPDASVVCDQPQFDDHQKDTVLNPTVLVEVLSDSTASYDRGKKFEHYRRLNSLKQYLLVEQDHPHVDLYTKQSDGSWALTDASGLDTTIQLSSIECQLPLAEVYRKVEFPEIDLARAGIFRE